MECIGRKICRHVPVCFRSSGETVAHGAGRPHHTEAEEAFRPGTGCGDCENLYLQYFIGMEQFAQEVVLEAGKDEKASCQKDTQYHQQVAWLCEAGSGLPGGGLSPSLEVHLQLPHNPGTLQADMLDNKVNQVENRIVSISQLYLRPVVRGKAKAPVEFGAKYDVSIDEVGHARLEKVSFDHYNESSIFQDVLERYKVRTGHYPKRVLVDQIYRIRKIRGSQNNQTGM